MKLPYDYSRCFNTTCQRRWACARYTSKPNLGRMVMTNFQPTKGKCSYQIENTTVK